jgi:hypothetical protein
MGDLDRLDDLAAACDAQVHAVRSRLEDFAASLWASLPDYRDDAIDRMVEAIVPRVIAGQVRIAELTRAYLAQCAREIGLNPDLPPVDRDEVTGSRGVDPKEVYRRAGASVWSALADGDPVDRAVAAGGLRLHQLIGGDLQLARRAQARTSMRASGARMYRRILTGRENCALCVVASTQRYWVENLMPIHPGCDCGQGPLPLDYDGGQVIDSDTLERVHDIVAQRYGVSDRGARSPDYRDVLLVTEHGEYGPVLSFKGARGRRRASGKGSVTIPEGMPRPKPHEIRTAQALAAAGHEVVFRVPVNQKGVKNPDVDMDGQVWEFKAPEGGSEKNTISDQFKKARSQSRRLVIDLRRCKLSDPVACGQIERRFRGQSRIVEIMVIDHNGVITILTHSR